MTRACEVQDDRLIDYADGVEFDVDFDEHVAGCDECQAFVAELWEGGLGRDLVEPIMATIRLELFLIEAAKLGGGIVADMLQVFAHYLDPGLGKE